MNRPSTRAHKATLLHYVAANGVEDFRQRTPPNIVAIAEMLLSAGSDVDSIAEIYGSSTALGLAASSVHPERAGVQNALLAVLLGRGACIDGVEGCAIPILAALHNGRGEAARYLADQGARLDLESAAGTGHVEAVRGMLTSGVFTTRQRTAGLAWACHYGHPEVVELLLESGADLNETFGGQTPLHWAAMNAKTECAKRLLMRGASRENINRYGATPLGQAEWSASHDERPERYEPVVELLRESP